MSLEKEGTSRSRSPGGDGDDVRSSLAEMDRRLHELQRDLASVRSPAAPDRTDAAAIPDRPHEPAIPDQTDRPTTRDRAAAPADPGSFTGAAPAHEPDPLDRNGSFDPRQPTADRPAPMSDALFARDAEAAAEAARQFLRSAQALVEQYERMIRHAGLPGAPAAPNVGAEPPVAPPQPPGVPPYSRSGMAPVPAPQSAWPAGEPWPSTADRQPPPPAASFGPESADMDGAVVLNAGPFADIATLSAFEQALERLPRVSDVYVRGFEGNRAFVDLQLAGPVRLVDAMRKGLPFTFRVSEAAEGSLMMDIDPAARA